MKTLNDIKDRCVIDEDTDCWSFKGAFSRDGQPRVWFWDYNKERMVAMPGRRAVWFAVNQKPLPNGWRVYGVCDCVGCLNPAHSKAGPAKAWGQHMSKSGKYKGSLARLLANRKTGAARSVLTPQTLQEILSSNETGTSLARRLGISQQTVSKARRGHLIALTPISSPFTGLMGVGR